MIKYNFSNYPCWRILHFILHSDNCSRKLSFLDAIDKCFELTNKSCIN